MCSARSNAFEASKNTAWTDEPWVIKYEAVCFCFSHVPVYADSSPIKNLCSNRFMNPSNEFINCLCQLDITKQKLHVQRDKCEERSSLVRMPVSIWSPPTANQRLHLRSSHDCLPSLFWFGLPAIKTCHRACPTVAQRFRMLSVFYWRWQKTGQPSETEKKRAEPSSSQFAMNKRKRRVNSGHLFWLTIRDALPFRAEWLCHRGSGLWKILTSLKKLHHACAGQWCWDVCRI